MNRATIALTLSIVAIVAVVKAQEEISPSFKKSSSPHEFVKNDFTTLIQTIISSGSDSDFPNGFAQAVGLTQAMPSKGTHSDISHHGDKEDSRECHVVYAADDNGGRRPVCVLISRIKNTKSEMSSKYYRVSLKGKLENVVTLNAMLDANGKGLAEGHSRFEEDIASPDTQKAFKAEMAYWVNVWLKKQRKVMTDPAVH